MSEHQTFTGTERDLVLQLAGNSTDVPDAVAEEAGFAALEFFADQEVRIQAVTDRDDGLELALGGPVFFSVQKFLWDAAAGIVGLAIALAADQSDAVTSAVALVKSMLSSVSVFRADTVEFQAYSAVATLQKRGEGAVTAEDVRKWLGSQDRDVAGDDLAAGIAVLVERGLVRKAADGSLRIRL